MSNEDYHQNSSQNENQRTKAAAANNCDQAFEKQVVFNSQQHNRNECLSLRQSSNNQHFSGHFFNSNQLMQMSDKENGNQAQEESAVVEPSYEQKNNHQRLANSRNHSAYDQVDNFNGSAQLQQNTFASKNNFMFQSDDQFASAGQQNKKVHHNSTEAMVQMVPPAADQFDNCEYT